MFPKKCLSTIKKQNGNLYIVAIFVIVVMGFLADALARMAWSNSDALSKDLLGTRAWLAAHSVNELALTHLYPLDSITSEVDTACSNWSASDANSLIGQFEGCAVVTSCNPLSTLDSVKYYRIDTAVRCGSGPYLVERQQDVWVKA